MSSLNKRKTLQKAATSPPTATRSQYIGIDNFPHSEKASRTSCRASLLAEPVQLLSLRLGAPITALPRRDHARWLDACGNRPSAEDQEAKMANMIQYRSESDPGILDKVGAGKVIPKNKLAGMTVGDVANELTKKGYAKEAVDLPQTS